MAVLEADDVGGWDRSRVDREMGERMDAVNAIRERNGGTLVGVAGPEADLVREHMLSLNALGERKDTLLEQEAADGTFQAMSDYLNEPDPERSHPGHSKAKQTQAPRDVGSLFAESDAIKQFNERGALNIPVTVPTEAVFGRTFQSVGEIPGENLRMQAALFDSTGFPTRQDIRTDIVDTLYQANNIGPLMPQGSTDSDTIQIGRAHV